MHKIIILILLISQFSLGCSFRGDKEILVKLDCPKHFVISDANSILFKNNSIISILNTPNLNCYQKISEPNNVYIDITNNYLLLNAPETEYFESKFNALFFITNRSETMKIHSKSEEILFNNSFKDKSKSNQLYLNRVNLQFYSSIVVELFEYQQGLKLFSAIN